MLYILPGNYQVFLYLTREFLIQILLQLECGNHQIDEWPRISTIEGDCERSCVNTLFIFTKKPTGPFFNY